MNSNSSYEVEGLVRRNRIISPLPSTSNEVIEVSSDNEDESEWIELNEESIKAFKLSTSDKVIELNSDNDDESECMEFNEESIKSFKIYKHDLQTNIDEYLKLDCTTISPNDENKPSTSGLNNKSAHHSMALKRNYFLDSPQHGPKKIIYTNELVAEMKDKESPFDYSFCDSLIPSFNDTESKDDAQKKIKLNIYPHFSPISSPSTRSSALVVDDSNDMFHLPATHVSSNIDTSTVLSDQRRFTFADLFQG